MQDTVSARSTPAHLWIVGILSLLWNGFGGYDYTMTRTRNLEYLGKMGDANSILAYIDAMPIYAQFGWGLGVWGALLGAILLLMRSRYAVHAFAASLVGAVVSFAGQYLGPPPPPEMIEGGLKYVPLVIVALAALQLWYAARQARTGVLR